MADCFTRGYQTPESKQ